MGIFKRKLNQRYKLLAVQVAREQFEKSGGNAVEFERLVREDSRVKALDPALIILFLKVAWMVFEYFRNKPVTGAESASDTEIYANSLRYEV